MREGILIVVLIGVSIFFSMSLSPTYLKASKQGMERGSISSKLIRAMLAPLPIRWDPMKRASEFSSA